MYVTQKEDLELLKKVWQETRVFQKTSDLYCQKAKHVNQSIERLVDEVISRVGAAFVEFEDHYCPNFLAQKLEDHEHQIELAMLYIKNFTKITVDMFVPISMERTTRERV